MRYSRIAKATHSYTTHKDTNTSMSFGRSRRLQHPAASLLVLPQFAILHVRRQDLPSSPGAILRRILLERQHARHAHHHALHARHAVLVPDGRVQNLSRRAELSSQPRLLDHSSVCWSIVPFIGA